MERLYKKEPNCKLFISSFSVLELAVHHTLHETSLSKIPYIIQKGRLSLNLRPPYTKERIQKALETIQIAREEKSKGS